MITAELPGLGHDPKANETFRVTIDNGDPIELISYEADGYIIIEDSEGTFYIKLGDAICDMYFTEEEIDETHSIKLEELRYGKIDEKYLNVNPDSVYIYDENDDYHKYSICEVLNLICSELSLNHSFISSIPDNDLGGGIDLGGGTDPGGGIDLGGGK